MPRGDRTGPNGMGPMTGRAFGYCSGHGAPGYATAPGPGMGMGWGNRRGYGRGGYGQGMGWGRRGFAGPVGPAGAAGPYYGWSAGPVSAENQKQVLKDEMSALEERMRFLQREMDAMDTSGEDD